MSGYPIRRDIVLRGDSASFVYQKDFHRRLELLFNVHVNVSAIDSRKPKLQYKDRCEGGELVIESEKSDGWVTVRGKSEEDCIKTQRYVLASSKPECRVLVPCGPQLVKLLFEDSPALRDTIEREYEVLVVAALKDGGLYIQGAQSSVAAAISRVHRLADTIPPYSDIIQTHSTTNQSPISSSILTPDRKNLIIRDPTCIATTIPANKIHYRDNNHSLLRPYSLDTSIHQRINKYVQLGFSVEHVQSVIESLGYSASENDIMSRLILGNVTKSNPLVLAPPLPSKEGLRPIVIDGSNVAMKHGNGKFFSCRGIEIALLYFRSRGHSEITIFVPQWRKEPSRPETPIKDQEILFKLEEAGFIKFTPSRRFGNRKIVCYDDRFIVQLANVKGGIIVSDDNFRDLFNENPSWRETIEKRVLQFVFVEDDFMVPQDPLGKHGLRLDAFLRFERGMSPNRESSYDQSAIPKDKTPCPYKEKCTFGPRCRYYHPERESKQREKECLQEDNVSPRPDSRSRDKEDEQLAMKMNQLNFQTSSQKSVRTQPLSYVDSPHDRPGGYRNTHPLVGPMTQTSPSMTSSQERESVHSSYSRLPHDQWMTRDDHNNMAATPPLGLHYENGYPKYPDAPLTMSQTPYNPSSFQHPHSHPHSHQRPHTHPHLISPHLHHHSQYSIPHHLHGNERQGYSANIPSSRSHSANIVGAYSTGYSHYKDPRELEQIQSLDTNQKMIYEKTVELFPQHRERILAIIIQYHISDINTLIQLLGK